MKYVKNLSLYRAFKNAADDIPNNVAIYYYGNRISFAKLDHLIDKWASILQNDFDIKKGDSVLISLPNIPQTIILLYAVNKIGGICNMVHPNTPSEGMQKYYDESNCKVAFLFDQKVYKELKAYKSFKGNIIICDAETFFLTKIAKRFVNWYNGNITKKLSVNSTFGFFKKFKTNCNNPIEVPLNDKETSVLLHSASTTGVSKTIKLSGDSFNFTASRVPEIMCMSEEDLVGKTMISILPSFHGFGLCMTMHAPLVNKFSIGLIPKFKASSVVKMMFACKEAISICGVPSVFKNLLLSSSFTRSKHIKSLRSCFSGGDSLPSIIKENFDSLMVKRNIPCRLFEGYGLTETLSVSVVNTHRRHKYGSVGYPIRGVSIRILDEENNILKCDEVGEIAIKSSHVMLGYLNEEDNSADIYSDGYLKTGDIGYLDEDGFLYFCSRKKRVIKVSGVAVFPSEIEKVISNISGIKGVCIVQIPDEKTANAAKAFVISDNKDKDRIILECKKHLISWSIPKEIEFVNKLPYTKYHKVNYKKLQKEEDQRRGLC